MSLAETERTDEEGIYLIVPRYLENNVNILNQPPFDWLEFEQNIFPNDFFDANASDERIAIFLRAYLKGKDKGPDLNRQVSSKYKGTTRISATINKINDYLERYPYAYNYLSEIWLHSRAFDTVGVSNGSHDQILTYAAYASAHSDLERTSKMAGLGEILPDDSAALPVKIEPSKESNKNEYRVYKIK